MLVLCAYDIIKRPIITERSLDQLTYRHYTFEVHVAANKIEIARAVQELFDVKVERVTTMKVKGKVKRVGARFGKRADYKKAVVKLTVDSKAIDVFAS